MAAHTVHVDDSDIATLARRGVGVAHCPGSNAALGVGVHPLRATRRGGVAVGLGTDSPVSGGRYDLLYEANTCRDTHSTEPPTDDELLALITIGAAQVAGRANLIGSLTPGKAADIIAIPLEGRSPHQAIFAPNAAPDWVMIDGVVRVRDGRVEA